jgi:hypothetical protein
MKFAYVSANNAASMVLDGWWLKPESNAAGRKVALTALKDTAAKLALTRS